MSSFMTVYCAVCDACGVHCHAGQRSGEKHNHSLAYGYDDSLGMAAVADFMFSHARCTVSGVRVVSLENLPYPSKRWDYVRGEKFPAPLVETTRAQSQE